MNLPCRRCSGRGFIVVTKGVGPDGRASQVGERTCPKCNGTGRAR